MNANQLRGAKNCSQEATLCALQGKGHGYFLSLLCIDKLNHSLTLKVTHIEAPEYQNI